jgi:chromosome partitioning protein
MTRKIAIISSKGGISKTTASINLAAAIASTGKSVLIVDCDSQSQAARALGITYEQGLADVILGRCELKEAITEARPGLYLLPAGDDLPLAEREIDNNRERFIDSSSALSVTLKPIATLTDYIILDNPPSWGIMSINSLMFADEILIPTLLEALSIDGLVTFLKRVEVIQNHREALNRPLKIAYILPSMVDMRLLQSRELLEQLERNFEGLILPSIPNSVRVSESAAHGETIFEYAPDTVGAAAFKSAAERILNDE